MLSDSDPDPLDKLDHIIRSVGKSINEKNENKKKARLSGKKICAPENFKSSNYSLQNEFKKFDDSVQKYVKDVKSCTGLDRDPSKKYERPKSNVISQESTECKALKREDTFTIEDKKSQKKEKRKELAKRKKLIDSDDSSDEDSSYVFGPRTIITQAFVPEEEVLNNTPQEPAEDTSLIDKAKEEELERKRQERLEKRKAIYDTWFNRKALELKKKAKKDKELKEEQERKKKEEEIKRKEIQEKCFKSWLNKKQEEKKVHVIVEEMKKKEAAAKKSEAELQHLEKKISATEMWEAKKKQALKKKKEAESEKLKKEESRKEEKKQKAKQKYREWVRTAHLKPKPTPLNRGLESYVCRNVGWVNPIPWRTLDDRYC